MVGDVTAANSCHPASTSPRTSPCSRRDRRLAYRWMPGSSLSPRSWATLIDGVGLSCWLCLRSRSQSTSIASRWSKLGTAWRGVSVDTLLADVETDAGFALAHSYGGYTTNLPLEDLLDGKAWVAYGYDGELPEHGGPARLLVPHLYFWKSAKWVRGIELMDQDSPASGSNWDITTTATHGASSGIRGLKVRRAWRAARLVERRTETASASTLVLEVPGWPGHLAGQHVDVRLTAPDGYQAARSYSLAAPANGDRVEITVQRVADGEVSSYLADEARSVTPSRCGGRSADGSWKPEDNRPVLLVAGGSGVVPLMAMIRSRRSQPCTVPPHLLGARSEDQIYDQELRRRVTQDGGLDVTVIYTRSAPEGEQRPLGRISADDLVSHGWPADVEPTCYVCGPTAFVETVGSAGRSRARPGQDQDRAVRAEWPMIMRWR